MEVVPLHPELPELRAVECQSWTAPAVEANFAHLFPIASSVASPWFLNIGHGGHSHNVALGKCYKSRLLGEPVVPHFITSTPLAGERQIFRRTSSEDKRQWILAN